MVSYSTGSLRSCGVQQVQEISQQSSLCEHLSLMLSSSNIALESFKNRQPTNMLPLSERCLALMESLPAPMKRMMKMLMALVMRILLPRQAGALMTQLADAQKHARAHANNVYYTASPGAIIDDTAERTRARIFTDLIHGFPRQDHTLMYTRHLCNDRSHVCGNLYSRYKTSCMWIRLRNMKEEWKAHAPG